MKRYAAIHGHFYQPPRENPWTGEVERQPSAGSDHDWNARIARECYVPNGEARVLDGSGRIADIVDNYAWISFNFGPTLLSWLQGAEPAAYARLLEADRESAGRQDGHGNALAQAYHHAILPLSDPRDRLTEIRWGLADFKARFGRDAEGLWLPECAADDATLAACAAEGVAFVILEPHQAEAVRPLAGGAWKPASEALKPGIPYKWTDGERSLALFFYDGPLSRSVAFEKAMRDSRAFATRISSRLPPAAEDGLALLATDGESYGHHEPFAEMGLAHLLRYALPEAGVTPASLGWYLAKHPPRFEARLKAGGTSWSCEHGVERWRSDCGCGSVDGRGQAWRAPLRAALERLRSRLAALYERESKGLLPDPWAARDAYISVVLDRSKASVSRFLGAHAPGAKDDESRRKALELLELQRHALMMFTSCGWFFDELSRLEPVQVLLYAARALELARGFGEDHEPELVSALAAAPSAEPAFGDGAGIWEKLVRPQVVTPDHVAAHYATALLFQDEPPKAAHHHPASCERLARRVEGGVSAVAGRATFRDGATGRPWSRTFVAAVLPGQKVQAFVAAGELPPERVDALLAAAVRGQETELPAGRLFRLRDLRPDEREKALTLVLRRRLARWQDASRDQLEEALPLAEQFKGLDIPLPPGLSGETRLALSHAAGDAARRFAEAAPGALEELRALLARAKAAGLGVPGEQAEEPFARGFERLLSDLEAGADGALEAVDAAAEAGNDAGLTLWRPQAQVRVFRWLRGGPRRGDAARLAERLRLAVP